MAKTCWRESKKRGTVIHFLFFVSVLVFHFSLSGEGRAADPRPPAHPVKLIFIHHSCGENWLADGHGRLGIELGKNNYFVSDTNYGWGPDGIGDRTDITDWPEWFLSGGSKKYLDALYRESEKHSHYTRNLKDPGGENRVIMFKSCFPNSHLEGPPNAPAKRGEGLTVANAKAIYNELLEYFSERPDKLFIAVTAPPLLDGTHSKNARAFNTWLVRDWLREYRGHNVAVFDFYNVLTGPDNHHRIRNGKIAYVNNEGQNTLHYPTGSDEHPSKAGNRKATGEFIPLLNTYYNAWAPGAPQNPPQVASPSGTKAKPPQEPSHRAESSEKAREDAGHVSGEVKPGEVIADFESGLSEWAVFSDEGKDTRLTFGRDTGMAHASRAAMRIEYDIAPESWATCSLVYTSPRDVSKTGGIEVSLHSEKKGQEVTLVVYQGTSPDELMHFEFKAQIDKEGTEGWQPFVIPWDRFTQPPWQGESTKKFNPSQSMGFAFAFDSNGNRRNKGVLWVDDVRFLKKRP